MPNSPLRRTSNALRQFSRRLSRSGQQQSEEVAHKAERGAAVFYNDDPPHPGQLYLYDERLNDPETTEPHSASFASASNALSWPSARAYDRPIMRDPDLQNAMASAPGVMFNDVNWGNSADSAYVAYDSANPAWAGPSQTSDYQVWPEENSITETQPMYEDPVKILIDYMGEISPDLSGKGWTAGAFQDELDIFQCADSDEDWEDEKWDELKGMLDQLAASRGLWKTQSSIILDAVQEIRGHMSRSTAAGR